MYVYTYKNTAMHYVPGVNDIQKEAVGKVGFIFLETLTLRNLYIGTFVPAI